MTKALTKALFLLLAAFTLAACGVTAQQRAAGDDQTCKSYGAKPGSDVYVQCRLAQQARRDRESGDVGAGLEQAGRALQSIDQPTAPMGGGGTTRLQTTCFKQGIYTV